MKFHLVLHLLVDVEFGLTQAQHAVHFVELAFFIFMVTRGTYVQENLEPKKAKH